MIVVGVGGVVGVLGSRWTTGRGRMALRSREDGAVSVRGRAPTATATATDCSRGSSAVMGVAREDMVLCVIAQIAETS